MIPRSSASAWRFPLARVLGGPVRGMALGALLMECVLCSVALSATGEDVQSRIDRDLSEGRAVVVHVIVALCDNENQGIVPVPKSLGNGQDPRTNLYWGALYGVRTHLPRKGGWEVLTPEKPEDERILARAVFHDEIERGGKRVPVAVVADAWDGAKIRPALRRFLDMAGGHHAETVTVTRGEKKLSFQAGGAAHLVAWVGHNGLMDFTVSRPRREESAEPRSALVLACASQQYFLEDFRSIGAHSLLLTTGLMAPEAYTLDAAIRAWVTERDSSRVAEAAARAYHQYQKCGLSAARRLFWSAP